MGPETQGKVPGTVAWVYMEGFPWWPARIVDRAALMPSLDKDIDIPPERTDNRMVQFFNDNNRIAVVSVQSILAYKEHNFLRTADLSNYRDVRDACIEAEDWMRENGKDEQLPRESYVVDKTVGSSNGGNYMNSNVSKVKPAENCDRSPAAKKGASFAQKTSPLTEEVVLAHGGSAAHSHRTNKANSIARMAQNLDPWRKRRLSIDTAPGTNGRKSTKPVNMKTEPILENDDDKAVCIKSSSRDGQINFEVVKRWKFCTLSGSDLETRCREDLLQYVSEQSRAIEALQSNLDHVKKELASERERIDRIAKIVLPGNSPKEHVYLASDPFQN